MNPEKLLGVLKGLTWTGKHDGKPVSSVRKVDCGVNLDKQLDWFKVAFTEVASESEHVLMAKTALTNPGMQGGGDHITLDDQPVGSAPADAEDYVLGLQFQFWPPGAKIVMAYKFTDADGTAHRYEFASSSIGPNLAAGLL